MSSKKLSHELLQVVNRFSQQCFKPAFNPPLNVKLNNLHTSSSLYILKKLHLWLKQQRYGKEIFSPQHQILNLTRNKMSYWKCLIMVSINWNHTPTHGYGLEPWKIKTFRKKDSTRSACHLIFFLAPFLLMGKKYHYQVVWYYTQGRGPIRLFPVWSSVILQIQGLTTSL